MVRHTALWLDSFTSVLPVEPLPFEEVHALAPAIRDRMTEAGWERYAHWPEYSPLTIAEKMGSAHTIARFRACGPPGTGASITVTSYDGSSPGYSISPSIIVKGMPSAASRFSTAARTLTSAT